MATTKRPTGPRKPTKPRKAVGAKQPTKTRQAAAGRQQRAPQRPPAKKPANVVSITTARKTATTKRARSGKEERRPLDHPKWAERPSKGGRPSKLTPELTEALCKHVSEGNYPEVAARLVGISESTYYQWMRRGRMTAEQAEDQGLDHSKLEGYRSLYTAVKEAEAYAEALLVSVVRRAAIEDMSWTAAMTLAERRWPSRYGRRDRDHVATGEDPVSAGKHDHDLGRAADILNVLQEAGALQLAMAPEQAKAGSEGG